MVYWDALYLHNDAGAQYHRVQANVFTKSHGIESTGVGADGVSVVTMLKAVLPPSVDVTVGQVVTWQGTAYQAVSVVPIAAKGIVRHIQVELSRAIG